MFRKAFSLEELPQQAKIHISADSKYRLYINGQYVCMGPLKGTEYERYYDTVDIAPYLKPGENVIGVRVLHFHSDYLESLTFQTGPISLVNASRGGLFVESTDGALSVDTDESWQCAEDPSYTFVEAEQSKYAGDQERVDERLRLRGWSRPGEEQHAFHNAVVLCPARECRLGGVLYEWQLKQRSLPMLYEKPIKPSGVTRCSPDIPFQDLLCGKPVTIPPGTEAFFELDMGELVTAFVNVVTCSGSGGEIAQLLYSECYCAPGENEEFPVKMKRDDYRDGVLYGETDALTLGKGEQEYEPYFFRTFRYLRFSIHTGEKPVVLQNIRFRLTGYPLGEQGSFQAEDKTLEAMWNISRRTLERCAHDSFVDCPYYEQMQYVMDAMLEALFGYSLSNDDRLARKALYDFHATLRPDGMIACNSPAQFKQIIPIYAIYFIDMVYHHYLYYADKKVLRDYLPTIYRILTYFEDRIEAKTGLVGRLGYWEFIDWVEEWKENRGSPVAEDDDRTVYLSSMIYTYGLRRAEELFGFAGMKDVAGEITRRHAAMVRALNRQALDTHSGYYNTAEGIGQKCQHAQLWAVLAGCVEGPAAAKLMGRCLSDPNLLRCSYSMTFYLFRACEAAGVYEKTIPVWNTWKDLVRLGVTTWPEDPVDQRSDCHGWSALPLFEFPAAVAGVRPAAPGFETVLIHTQALGMGSLGCKIPYKDGEFLFSRTVEERGAEWFVGLSLTLPRKQNILLELPDGSRLSFCSDRLQYSYSVLRPDQASAGGEEAACAKAPIFHCAS